MTESEGAEDADRAVLEAIYADFLSRLEAGEPADFEELAARHPQHEPELRSLHAGCTMLRGELVRMRSELAAGGNGLGAGARVSGFRLVRLLGRGGMGEVWEAEEPALSRRVALKLLLPERLTERGIGFFEREARAAGRVRHPGIVTIHAAGRSQGVMWLAQELVEGERTLANLLEEARASKPLAASYYRGIAELFRDLARAVGAAHDAGVVHRDLKPRNVLLCPDGSPKVADFGLARIADEASLSRSGDVVGTYSYMSPEQVSARRGEVGPHSDVFSAGVMLYEALSLARPFEAETTHALASQVLFHDPPDPDRVRKEVPHDLAVICKKALEKAPGQRFASMAELADELDRFLERRPILTRPPGPLGRMERWVRRKPSVTAAIAFAAAAVIVIGAIARQSLRAHSALDRANVIQRVTQAQIAWDAGDLELARREVEAAREIDANDYLGHLVLCRGLMQMGRVEDAQAELELAFAKGFQLEGGEEEPALATCARALYHLAQGGKQHDERAEALLVAALAQDSRMRGASYALYQARLSLGNLEGARAALADLADVPLSRATSTLVRGLALELDGDPAGALQALDSLSDDDRRSLRAARVIGRLQLLTDDYAGAIESLRRAVEEAPRDEASWANLATALYRRYGLTVAAEVAACCDRALAVNPAQGEALALRGELALHALEAGLPRSGLPPGPGWDELDRCLAALREKAPGHSALAELESYRSTLHAHQLSAMGSSAAAIERFGEALRHDPRNLRARVQLAQELFVSAERPADALDELERAVASWESADGVASDSATTRRSQAPRPRTWYVAAQIWRMGAAARMRDLASALDARAAVEEELAAGFAPPPPDLITYVEFLATSPLDEIVDCERVHELIELHDLRRRFAGDPAGEAVLRVIGAACP